jgi:hypothetical protein
MLKRRLSKNQPRSVGNHSNVQHPNDATTGSVRSNSVVPSKALSVGNTITSPLPLPPPPTTTTTAALLSATSNAVPVVLNRRVYPNGCLKKTPSIPITQQQHQQQREASLSSSNNEAADRYIRNTNSTPQLPSVVVSSNASVHTTSTTKSTSPPSPPPPPLPLTPSVPKSPLTPPTNSSHQDDVIPHQHYHPPLLPQKKSVSFQEVYIREFERILGDNPSCSSGAPIRYGL